MIWPSIQWSFHKRYYNPSLRKLNDCTMLLKQHRKKQFAIQQQPKKCNKIWPFRMEEAIAAPTKKKRAKISLYIITICIRQIKF
jgi:hypothetical protein